jgi:hypothetical protein
VKYSAQGLETMLSSPLQPKLRKSGSTKHNRLIGKTKDIVTGNFRSTLLAAQFFLHARGLKYFPVKLTSLFIFKFGMFLACKRSKAIFMD